MSLKPTAIILILFLSAVIGALLRHVEATAAAKPAPAVPAYGGKFPYELDQDGLQMVMIELPIPFPGEYTVTLTQQGSASAAITDDFNGLFSINNMFTDTFQPGYFVAGLRGEPGASGWVQWMAAPVAGVE